MLIRFEGSLIPCNFVNKALCHTESKALFRSKSMNCAVFVLFDYNVLGDTLKLLDSEVISLKFKLLRVD